MIFQYQFRHSVNWSGSKGFIGALGRVKWLTLAGFEKKTCCICLFTITIASFPSEDLTILASSLLNLKPSVLVHVGFQCPSIYISRLITLCILAPNPSKLGKNISPFSKSRKQLHSSKQSNHSSILFILNILFP